MAARPVTTRPKLPQGLSPQEEVEWWDTHKDYWEATETADEVAEPQAIRRTKPITIRLPVAMLEALKREATQRAIPYQTLIRMWLKERLDRDAVA